MTWGIEQCRESCPTSVHRQVRAHELRLYLNPRTIFRQQEESPDRNVWKRLWIRHRWWTQAGGVNWSVSQNGRRSPKLFVSSEEDVGYLQLPRARRQATDRREIFYQDEGSDEEMEREDNPACGDYSRKYLEIVARHKETPWKSETDQVGWNSKDARSTKGNAYSHKRTSSLPSLMARAASSSILCS
jgi:hypothetical protein